MNHFHKYFLFNSKQFFSLALLLVALMLVAFYWICKAFNKLYLSRQSTEEANEENETTDETDAPKVKKRLKSLDIFRGIAIVLMIFVNSGGGHYWWIEHATWNGLHFADLVFPWFLFIMGVCVPMSIKSQLNQQIPKSQIVSKIIKVREIFMQNSLG
jgi:heparan-alpha-glucosaminide N-acetyltransferase